MLAAASQGVALASALNPRRPCQTSLRLASFPSPNAACALPTGAARSHEAGQAAEATRVAGSAALCYTHCMTKLEVRRIDGQLAVILPEEVVRDMGLAEGSAVSIRPVSQPSEQELLRLAEEIMEQRKDALAILAR